VTDIALLGDVTRGQTRPRGFAPWTPQAQTRVLLGQVEAVLTEYVTYLPLTCRQVFYRLVGAHGYAKTERAYERLCEKLARARRARLISMDAIRDDGGQRIEPTTFRDVEEFFQNMRNWASDFRLDRQEGQLTRLVLMCEAAGMAPQLAIAVGDYGLAVISSGGFESVTEKHRFAAELTQYRHDAIGAIEVLHIGDHDPSGAHLFLALSEDVQAFAEAFDLPVTFTRLAVTPEQIEELELPTAPPKPTDNRAFAGETCQAEAIPPDVLTDIVREAIESRLDHDAYQDVLEREEQTRRELIERLA
jgi:hypothetical protein